MEEDKRRLQAIVGSAVEDKREEQFLVTVLSNVLRNPADAKFRRLNVDSAPVRKYVVDNPAGFQLIQECGFALGQDLSHLELCEEHIDVRKLELVIGLLEKSRTEVEERENERDPLHLQATLKTLRHKHRKAHQQDGERKELLEKIERSRADYDNGTHLITTSTPTMLPYAQKQPTQPAVARSSSVPASFKPAETSLEDTLRVMRRSHRRHADQDTERQAILSKIRDAKRD
eukprot:TRINITY_DN1670_c0_g1_i1.p1 TRINITY_DN1670_c0_g1~~TRINITY_DN1670_c0_g1_i1.p1  ORF type:complete len:246 (+),score=50.19 TRINITY_DN1670_c0_g1_i1:46-738(+)